MAAPAHDDNRPWALEVDLLMPDVADGGLRDLWLRGRSRGLVEQLLVLL